MTRLAATIPVQGFVRWALRAPIWLYQHHLGWLFGHTGLLLTHRGRKSGLARHTVLEVLTYDKRTHTYIIAAGWGAHTDWLRNIEQTPQVEVQSGGEHLHARAVVLSADEAAQAVRDYVRRHPFRARAMSRLLLGQTFHAHQAQAFIRQVAQTIPLVALRPR